MATFLLIFIGVVSVYAFSNPAFSKKMLFNASLVYHNKEYYRLLSSGFIHGDWFHLGFNLYAFHLFSKTMIASLIQLGIPGAQYHLIALFVLGVIVSEIPSLFKHKDNPLYNSLGASGGVSSIVFAAIMLNPVGMRLGLIFIPIFLPAFIFGILYLIYSNYQAKKAADNINHDAHIVGALFGVVYALILFPNTFSNFVTQLMNWNGDIF